EGGHVAGFDLNEDAMNETASLVRAAGGRCLPFQGDVSKAESAEEFLAAVLAEYGAVDALVNNAGIIQPFVHFRRMTLQQVERVFGVNWYGIVHMTHAFLPKLIERPEASLVNVSSMGGFCPVPGQGVYGASKAAVKLLSESLVLELKGTGVRVTTVFPGGVRTNIAANAPDISEADKKKQLEKGGAYGTTAEDAARTIVRAIETGKERVTIGPDAKLLDALTRLAPRSAGALMAALMKRAGVLVADE
ncbi:MAG: SDR family NAD(P)-dependent oxidoreductase, partial [Polyangiaceae bacterium]|nr:SDR family NAD(P)-dependent oxidoreductase [Polyangiaceae bacterium]